MTTLEDMHQPGDARTGMTAPSGSLADAVSLNEECCLDSSATAPAPLTFFWHSKFAPVVDPACNSCSRFDVLAVWCGLEVLGITTTGKRLARAG